jgi:dTDP-4-dehydrorhamnose reductase
VNAPPIVVTGAAGQLGHALARALAPLGRVRALSRAECDLDDPARAADAVRALAPAVVVNAAAYTDVDGAEGDAERCARVNAVAPGALAAACAALGAPFVHFSTDYVFDGAAARPYTEDDAPRPLGVYGRTKLDGERAVADAGAAHVVFRTTWLYDPARGRNFVRTMRRAAREREELAVVADQCGAPTWVPLLAAAVAQVVGQALRAAEGPEAWTRRHAGVYHLAAAGCTTWHEFAEAAIAADPARAEHRVRRVRPLRTDEWPARARRPAYGCLDCTRARATFGVALPDWREQLALASAP